MQVQTKNADILMVEDNEAYATSLAEIIEELMDHKVTIAHDGTKALEMAREGSFDLFMIDINLPGKKGYEVAAEIRQIGRYKLSPMIAMTGEDQPDLRKRILQSGFNLYLMKPIDIDALTDIIDIYLRGLG